MVARCGKRAVQPGGSAPDLLHPNNRRCPIRQTTRAKTGETMNAQTAAKHAPAPQTPSLPQAKPESLGLSPVRLQRMSVAYKGEVEKGTLQCNAVMEARRGQVCLVEALGKLSPAASAPMAHKSIFRF